MNQTVKKDLFVEKHTISISQFSKYGEKNVFESNRTSKVYTTRLSRSYRIAWTVGANISRQTWVNPWFWLNLMRTDEKSPNIKTVVELTKISNKRKWASLTAILCTGLYYRPMSIVAKHGRTVFIGRAGFTMGQTGQLPQGLPQMMAKRGLPQCAKNQ